MDLSWYKNPITHKPQQTSTHLKSSLSRSWITKWTLTGLQYSGFPALPIYHDALQTCELSTIRWLSVFNIEEPRGRRWKEMRLHSRTCSRWRARELPSTSQGRRHLCTYSNISITNRKNVAYDQNGWLLNIFQAPHAFFKVTTVPGNIQFLLMSDPFSQADIFV